MVNVLGACHLCAGVFAFFLPFGCLFIIIAAIAYPQCCATVDIGIGIPTILLVRATAFVIAAFSMAAAIDIIYFTAGKRNICSAIHVRGGISTTFTDGSIAAFGMTAAIYVTSNRSAGNYDIGPGAHVCLSSSSRRSCPVLSFRMAATVYVAIYRTARHHNGCTAGNVCRITIVSGIMAATVDVSHGTAFNGDAGVSC